MWPGDDKQVILQNLTKNSEATSLSTPDIIHNVYMELINFSSIKCVCCCCCCVVQLHCIIICNILVSIFFLFVAFVVVVLNSFDNYIVGITLFTFDANFANLFLSLSVCVQFSLFSSVLKNCHRALFVISFSSLVLAQIVFSFWMFPVRLDLTANKMLYLSSWYLLYPESVCVCMCIWDASNLLFFSNIFFCQVHYGFLLICWRLMQC